MSHPKLGSYWKSAREQAGWKSILLLLSPLYAPLLMFWTEELLLSPSGPSHGGDHIGDRIQDRAVPGRL